MELKDLGLTIRKLRIERGLTQEELAIKSGYSNRSAIARIEKGEIDLPESKIKSISNALNVSPLRLMGWEDRTGDYIVPDEEEDGEKTNGNTILGRKIRTLRKSIGITQQQLAEKVGYNNRSMITHIEKGIINLPETKIREIAKALNVSLSDLLEEKALPKDPYYVDTSMLTETQLTELNTIINMNVSMFNSSRELTEHDRKMVIKVLTEAFINSLPNKK